MAAVRLGCTRLSRSLPTQGPLAGVGAPSGLPSRDQDPSIVPTHATAPDQGPHDHTSLFLPLVQPQGSGGGGCSAPQSHRGRPPPGAPSAWSWGGTPQTLSIKGKASLPRPPAFAWSGLVRPQTGAPARGRGLPPATWLLCPEGPLQPRSPERLPTGTPQVGLT